MGRKKLLSRDLDKLYYQFKEIVDRWKLTDVDDYKLIDRQLTTAKINAVLAEESKSLTDYTNPLELNGELLEDATKMQEGVDFFEEEE